MSCCVHVLCVRIVLGSRTVISIRVYMAPKSNLTAAVFQERYGELVSREYAQYTTAYKLRVALEQRRPPIKVSDGMLKVWLANTRMPADALQVSSAQELACMFKLA